jgi:SPP1 gp7 family putative phage head morphogenesis protein
MPDNLSDKLNDQITERAIDLQRVKGSVRLDVLAALTLIQDELVENLIRIGPTEVQAPRFQKTRMFKLFEQTKTSIGTGIAEVKHIHEQRLRELAEVESQFALNLLNTSIGVDVATVALTPEQLTASSTRSSIFGASSRNWWARQATRLQNQFADKIRSGVVLGKSTPEIVRTVRGTKAFNFEDGIMKLSKRQAEALVRTSVQNVANEARLRTYENNDDLIKAIQWVSTLDTRTTDICIALDGKQWTNDEAKTPIGHNKTFPGPTAHWNCRSSQVPITKSWNQLNRGRQFNRRNFQSEFQRQLEQQGFSKSQIRDIVADTRASMDGQVAQDLTFPQWLRKQSKARRVKVLGVERAALFDAGEINLNQLTNQDNRPLTLEQLRAKT